MALSGWLYFLFTTALALVMAGIIYYYYGPGANKGRNEEPKFRMLESEEIDINGGDHV